MKDFFDWFARKMARKGIFLLFQGVKVIIEETAREICVSMAGSWSEKSAYPWNQSPLPENKNLQDLAWCGIL